MNPNATIKVVHVSYADSRDCVFIRRSLLENPAISWEAKGLIGMILCGLPPYTEIIREEDIDIKAIFKRSRMPRRVFSSALTELRAAGAFA